MIGQYRALANFRWHGRDGSPVPARWYYIGDAVEPDVAAAVDARLTEPSEPEAVPAEPAPAPAPCGDEPQAGQQPKPERPRRTTRRRASRT